jgi:protein gp37
MALSKSKIDYLTHVWNFQTGCLNQEQGVCKLPCWAKAQAKRFGRSFLPELHLAKLTAPLPKEPARIGVCFTGDLFGDWINPDSLPAVSLRERVFFWIQKHPQHQFFFLTKCPCNLRKWGRFPDNAWVGATVCDNEMLNVAVHALEDVEAKNKWISFEPLLEKIILRLDDTIHYSGISWVVIGAQTHPTVKPKPAWVKEIITACDSAGIPVFLKDNLGWPLASDEGSSPYYRSGIGTWILRQELPR